MVDELHGGGYLGQTTGPASRRWGSYFGSSATRGYSYPAGLVVAHADAVVGDVAELMAGGPLRPAVEAVESRIAVGEEIPRGQPRL